MMAADTIFAVASGSGRAAVAVMRLSGQASRTVIAGLVGRLPAARRASLRTLRDAGGAVLDRGLVLWMPGPRSYTGEDSAELHLHGSRAVLAAVGERLVELGARPAAAGEFTQRAFLNGRMDLLEAEGIADLVEAETETQRRQALRQMDGALGAVYRGWTERTRDLLGVQEALIDFADDEVPEAVLGDVLAGIEAVAGEIGGHLADERRGERIRDGLMVAIVGAPNVGKSSLMNVLAGREVAITSPVPGTTRDALEARVELGGTLVTLIDTAGLRDTSDPIEVAGVQRARDRAGQADLVIEVVDETGRRAEEVCSLSSLLVRNKIDLCPGWRGRGVSALTGAGVPELRAELAAAARAVADRAGPPPLTRTRHRHHLENAKTSLQEAVSSEWPELRAEEMRVALRELGQLTGTVGTEEILDTIFRRFCIGK